MEPLASREVFRGRRISVAVEDWPAGEREVVHHPGASAIVAVTPSGDVLLVRQIREAIRTPLLEIPAGTRDVAGEDAETCAIRELLEETGYAGSNTRRLGWIYTSPGVMDERIDLFACQASEAPLEPAVELGVETVRMGFAQAIGAIRSGLIVDAKSITALLLEQGRARRGG